MGPTAMSANAPAKNANAAPEGTPSDRVSPRRNTGTDRNAVTASGVTSAMRPRGARVISRISASATAEAAGERPGSRAQARPASRAARPPVVAGPASSRR